MANASDSAARPGRGPGTLNAQSLLLPYALGLVGLCVAVQIALAVAGSEIDLFAQALLAIVALYFAGFLVLRHERLRQVRFGPLVAHALTYVIVNGSYQLHAAFLAFANGADLRGDADLPVDGGWLGPTLAMAGFWAVGFTIHALASIGQRGYDQ